MCTYTGFFEDVDIGELHDDVDIYSDGTVEFFYADTQDVIGEVFHLYKVGLPDIGLVYIGLDGFLRIELISKETLKKLPKKLRHDVLKSSPTDIDQFLQLASL